MPSDSIYLVTDEGKLQRIEHQLYASEELLQKLISTHPEILAGDQIDPENPPRWLLLQEEAAIPDAADTTGRWWIDHLLIDQFGIPTVVEVKRSTDTRIRREVVGQMLDYIANAQAYWTTGRMRQMLAGSTGSLEGADARVAEHLALADEPEIVAQQVDRFWQQVETNLREGNVRLLFVADELPRELRRLIEFLNEQFSRIEVLGVELRQYVGQGLKALVPRVVGQTVAVQERKERPVGTTPAVRTSREIFLEACGAEAAPVFSAALDAAADAGYETRWGTKGFSLRLRVDGATPSVIYGYPPGSMARYATLEAYLAYLQSPENRERLETIFQATPGFERVTDKTIRCVLSPGKHISPEDIAAAVRRTAKELAVH